MAIQDFIPQKSQFDTINLALMAISSKIGGSLPIANPDYIKAVCDAGLAQQVFKLGDQIVVQKETAVSVSVGNTSGTAGITAASIAEETFLEAIDDNVKGDYEFIYDGTVWKYNSASIALATYGLSVTGTAIAGDVIVVHETLQDVVFDIKHVTKYGIVLQLHNCLQNIQFDAPEALMAFPSGLAAGDYAVKLVKGSYGAGTAEDSVYYFTLTQPIPNGGYLRHSNMGQYSGSPSKDRVKGGNFITYNAQYAQIESVATAGYADETPSGYTLLGQTTADSDEYKVAGLVAVTNINLTTHNACGKGHYGESAARQWLNSNKAKGAVWAKQNNFDFPPSWMSTDHGFKHGLDQNFARIVAISDVVCDKNPSIGTGTYTCNDKFFFASSKEMGYTSSGAEGIVWDGWNGATNADRIKYLSGSAKYWWLRSPGPSRGWSGNERLVSTYGSLNYYDAYDSNGAVPACVIGSI